MDPSFIQARADVHGLIWDYAEKNKICLNGGAHNYAVWLLRICAHLETLKPEDVPAL